MLNKSDNKKPDYFLQMRYLIVLIMEIKCVLSGRKMI
jgi:hypothetical protein